MLNMEERARLGIEVKVQFLGVDDYIGRGVAEQGFDDDVITLDRQGWEIAGDTAGPALDDRWQRASPLEEEQPERRAPAQDKVERAVIVADRGQFDRQRCARDEMLHGESVCVAQDRAGELGMGMVA